MAKHAFIDMEQYGHTWAMAVGISAQSGAGATVNSHADHTTAIDGADSVDNEIQIGVYAVARDFTLEAL